jgi:hypothetical protein
MKTIYILAGFEVLTAVVMKGSQALLTTFFSLVYCLAYS